MNEEELTVYQATRRIIRKLETDQISHTAALLSALRGSVGKTLAEVPQIWPVLFENLPEGFLGNGRRETFEETAIYSTLQIYALCMQGAAGNVTAAEDLKMSLGGSLKSGRVPIESEALDKRFAVLMTAETFDELMQHLRHLIRIVKAKSPMMIDFAKLAEDLYWFQQGKGKNICFRWAVEYYAAVQQAAQQEKEVSDNE